MKKSSRIKGFYKKNRGERLESIRGFAELSYPQVECLQKDGQLGFDLADMFIENAVGSYALPMGIATNFKIDQKDYLVPMCVEESSVIAAASNAARWIYESGGFESEVLSSLMIGQIQIVNLQAEDIQRAERLISKNKEKLIKVVNDCHPRLLARGGGCRDIECRSFLDLDTPFMVLHLHIDTCEAMGANLVNTACESLAPHLEILCGGRVAMKILSNLADRRLFRARCSLNPEKMRLKEKNFPISGEEIGRRVESAFVFADTDPYRAATHNKGIMNGVDPVVIATGNDWRAIEAGAHAYAAKDGRYRSLSTWRFKEGMLHGELTLPLQLGTVGGITRLHPGAKAALRILGNPTSEELSRIIVCSGLASNLAALRALCTAGIQQGHMKLHAKNIALAVGAQGEEVDQVATQLLRQKSVTATLAESILEMIRGKPNKSFDFKEKREVGLH